MEKKTKKIIIYTAITALVLLIAFVIVSKTCIDCLGFGKKNIEKVDLNIEEKLKNLLIEKNTKLVIGLEGEKTIEVNRGTQNFGIPFAFSPTTSDAWGIDNTRCKYSLTITKQAGYCVNEGWDSIEQDVTPGLKISEFDHVNNFNNVGYAVIKINIPEGIQPCTQRFKISVECTALTEATTSYFDLKVI